MNIISGKYKNIALKSPNDSLTHPMGSREKLALFNSLTSYLSNNSFENLSVLDGFAGTGALGLEALSRGAKTVIFVEKSPLIAKTLQKNLKNVLKDDILIKKSTKIIVSDLKKVDFPEKFDLIFVDPPYDLYSEPLISPVVKFLSKSAILAISIPKTAPSPNFEGLTLISEKNYAFAKIILFQKNP